MISFHWSHVVLASAITSVVSAGSCYPPPTNAPVQGWVDLATTNRVAGWASDPDRPDTPITVTVQLTNSSGLPLTDGSGNPYVFSSVAAIPRSDVGAHGFDITYLAPVQGVYSVTVAAEDYDSSGAYLGTMGLSGSPAVVINNPLGDRFWRMSFLDDFRGPTGKPTDDFCFNQVRPQCIAEGDNQTIDCDQANAPSQFTYRAMPANMAAAVKTLDSSRPWELLDSETVRARYSQIVSHNMQFLDKCTWSAYQLTNIWATDYHGNYSSRFDPTQVRVDPTGKGYLALSAVKAPVDYDCPYGGNVAGPNCGLFSFAPDLLAPGVGYWVDASTEYQGVYYAQVDGACTHGGFPRGPNCCVQTFAPGFLDPAMHYWVDANYNAIFYRNTTYRCAVDRGSLDLTCPILNGGLSSKILQALSAPGATRGNVQLRGRFEVKARIPKGPGSFPAAWLMPQSGGWPFEGGEIDLMEARDAADAVFQTYHHGKCYLQESAGVIDLSVASPPVLSRGDCLNTPGGISASLSKEFQTSAASANEFWQRDHVFAVQWKGNTLEYYLNSRHVGTVAPGSAATALRMDMSGQAAPQSIASLGIVNFPTSPMFYILNHSAYVPPAGWSSFQPQTLLIDYVKSYASCDAQTDLCPCGGVFQEGVGCVLSSATALTCNVPTTVGGLVYSSPCVELDRQCVNGGSPSGPNCQVVSFNPGDVVQGVTYWVDSDPRWPGVYYAQRDGACVYGGSPAGPNCSARAFASDVLEPGVHYWVDADPRFPGVYYAPDFR